MKDNPQSRKRVSTRLLEKPERPAANRIRKEPPDKPARVPKKSASLESPDEATDETPAVDVPENEQLKPLLATGAKADSNVMTAAMAILSEQDSKKKFSFNKVYGKTKEDPAVRLRQIYNSDDDFALGTFLQNVSMNELLTEVELIEIARSLKPRSGQFLTFVRTLTNNPEGLILLKIAERFKEMVPKETDLQLVNLQDQMTTVLENWRRDTNVAFTLNTGTEGLHILPETDVSYTWNVSSEYSILEIQGQTQEAKLQSLIQQILLKTSKDFVSLWRMSSKAKTVADGKGIFIPVPTPLLNGLKNLVLDVTGAFLPVELEFGLVDPEHPFLAQFSVETKLEEVQNRRKLRSLIGEDFKEALSKAIANLRLYHYSLVTRILASCSHRRNCDRHVRWDQCKRVLEKSVKSGTIPTTLEIIEELSRSE